MMDNLPQRPDGDPPSASEMVTFFDAEIYGAACWLSDFSEGRNKRPDHDIENFRQKLRLRQWARYGYQRLAEAQRNGGNETP